MADMATNPAEATSEVDVSKLGTRKVAKFTFTIPTTAPNAEDRGKKVEKSFEYQEISTEDDARKILAAKDVKIVDVVNDLLKARARSNAYQNALQPYRPSEVPAEDIKERMIRDYIRLGIPEDTARKQVEGLLNAQAQK